jgi:hypothetical protein
MENLKAALQKARDNLNSSDLIQEKDVVYYVILPILRELGWPFDDRFRMKSEYKTGEGRRVDWALCTDKGKPLIFLEAKAKDKQLSGEPAKQLLAYAFAEGIGLAVLTNGIEWWLYLPLHQGEWSTRRFALLNLLEQDLDTVSQSLWGYLDYEQVCSGQAQKKARTVHQQNLQEAYIRENLPRVIEQLITSPSVFILEMFQDAAKSELGVSPSIAQVREALLTVAGRESSAVPPPPLPPSQPIPPFRPSALSSSPTPQGSQRLIGDPPKGSKPLAVTLREQKIEVRHWKQVLWVTANWLISQGYEINHERAPGSSRTFMGPTANSVRVPYRLDNRLYLETDYSAVNSCHHARWLLEQAGLSADELVVEYIEAGAPRPADTPDTQLSAGQNAPTPPQGRQRLIGDPPKGSKPLAIMLRGERLAVGSWRQIIVTTANWLIRQGYELPTGPRRSGQRVFISSTPASLKNPQLLENELYLDAPFMNANNSYRHTRWLLEQAGLSSDELIVEYVEAGAPQPDTSSTVHPSAPSPSLPPQGRQRLIGEPPKGSKPLAVTLGGERIVIKYWKQVMTTTANWLIRQGYQLPVGPPQAGQRDLINTTTQSLRVPHKLENGLYIETYLSAERSCRYARWLLEQASLPAEELVVEYREDKEYQWDAESTVHPSAPNSSPTPQGRQRLIGEPPKGSKPLAVTLGGQRIVIKYWKQVLVTTANWLINQGHEVTHERAPMSNRVFISSEASLVRLPYRLANGLYMETNHSAVTSCRYARWLLQQAGLAAEELVVEYEGPGEAAGG